MNNGAASCVAVQGGVDDPAVLLVGSSMLSWPDELCDRLVAGGRRVIRYGPPTSSARRPTSPSPTTARWRERLGDITALTLVLHGEDDPFFPIGNGVALAAEVPGARLVRLGRVGHPAPGPRRPDRRGGAHRTRRADRATVEPRQDGSPEQAWAEL